MKSPARIVILSLAKNCAHNVPKLANFAKSLTNLGLSTFTVVGENGSTDGTRDAIKDVITDDASWALVETDEIADTPDRLNRIAHGRHLLQSHVLDFHPHADFVIVLDLDNVFDAPPSAAEIVSAIAELNDDDTLFAISATTSPYYYDLLALRAPGIFSDNIAPRLAELRNNWLRFYVYLSRYVFANQRYVTSLGGFRATSAFNGLCIYRSAAFAMGSYLSTEIGTPVCEHVTMNEQIHLKTGAYIQVSERIVLAMPREHGPRGIIVSLIEAVRRRLPRLRTIGGPGVTG